MTNVFPACLRRLGALSLAWCIASATLPACTGMDTSSEDLNVLIPKLISGWSESGNVDAAMNLFNTENPDARRLAIAYISAKPWGHEEPYMKAYRMLATDPVPLVRAQALRALGSSHRSDVSDLLIAGLGDASPLVRRDAAAAIKDIRSDAVIPALLDHLKSDVDEQTRANCAQALNGYNQPQVLRGLADALADHYLPTVRYAWMSLRDMTKQDLPDDPRPWLEYLQSTTQR